MNPTEHELASATSAGMRQGAEAAQVQGGQETQPEGNDLLLQQRHQQGGQSGLTADQPQSSEANTGLSTIGNEIKRLQQLHQLQNPQVHSNALLVNPGQSHDQTNFLQSVLDGVQQKVHAVGTGAGTTPRPETLSALPNTNTNNNGHAFPLPNLFNLMAQNQLQQQALQLQQQRLVAASSNSSLPLPAPHAFFNRDGTRRLRGGVIEPFPEKLHRLLTEVEIAGRSDVVSFVGDGRAFVVHKPEEFCKDIVPLYFRQTRLSSFKRQLNLYGFELINTGIGRGGYFHPDFVKGKPLLCRRMRRIPANKAKKKTEDDTEQKTATTNKASGESNAKQDDSDKTTTKQGGRGINVEK